MVALVAWGALSGCVSTQEHESALQEIAALRNGVQSKEAENTALLDELERLKAERDNLQQELLVLRKEHADLSYRVESDRYELIREITALEQAVTSRDLTLRALRDEMLLNDRKLLSLEAERDRLLEEAAKIAAEKKAVVTDLMGTYEELVRKLNEDIREGQIAITQLRGKLTLSMAAQVLFNSGSADINKKGRGVLGKVAEALSKITDKEIRVEGHTDNVPISPRLAMKFPSNWELSSQRAVNVVKYLMEAGIDPGFLSTAAYAEYQPVASNEAPEGRAKNRRIEIVLVPLERTTDAPEDAAGLQENE